MPLETVHLPSDEYYPQRTAAAFLSIVAYPSNLNKRRRFELAAGSSVLRRRALDNPEWAMTPQTVTPGLLLMNPQTGTVQSREPAAYGHACPPSRAGRSAMLTHY